MVDGWEMDEWGLVGGWVGGWEMDEGGLMVDGRGE